MDLWTRRRYLPDRSVNSFVQIAIGLVCVLCWGHLQINIWKTISSSYNNNNNNNG